MDKKTFYRNIEQILELPVDTINGNEELASLEGWDSLAVLGFIAFADDKHKIIVSPTDIKNAKIVNDLMLLLKQ